MDYFGLSIKLSRGIKGVLRDCLALEPFYEKGGFSGQDLEADVHVTTAFKESIKKEMDGYACNIMIRHAETSLTANAKFTLVVHPITDMGAWFNGKGHPFVVIAFYENNTSFTYGNAQFVYMEGLLTGDVYYSVNERSYFISKHLKREYSLCCAPGSEQENADFLMHPVIPGNYNRLTLVTGLLGISEHIETIGTSISGLHDISRHFSSALLDVSGLLEGYHLLALSIFKNAGGIAEDQTGQSLFDEEVDLEKRYQLLAGTSPLLIKKIRACLSESVSNIAVTSY